MMILQAAGSPSTALPYALSCISLSASLHLLTLGATALLTVAQALLALNPAFASEAMSVLDSAACLLLLLGQAGRFVRSRTLMTLTQCQLAVVQGRLVSWVSVPCLMIDEVAKIPFSNAAPEVISAAIPQLLDAADGFRIMEVGKHMTCIF